MSDQPTITHATREDVPTILSLIQELADYEHALDSVKATVESLTETLILAPNSTSAPSGSGYAKVFILRLPNSSDVAGMALYFNNYSTWRAAPGIYLEDLYVRKEYRGRGYGKLLIQALAKETVAIGGKRLEWSCLKWNEPSLKFYKGLGATQMVDWVGLRVDGEALERLAGTVDGKAKVEGL